MPAQYFGKDYIFCAALITGRRHLLTNSWHVAPLSDLVRGEALLRGSDFPSRHTHTALTLKLSHAHTQAPASTHTHTHTHNLDFKIKTLTSFTFTETASRLRLSVDLSRSPIRLGSCRGCMYGWVALVHTTLAEILTRRRCEGFKSWSIPSSRIPELVICGYLICFTRWKMLVLQFLLTH